MVEHLHLLQAPTGPLGLLQGVMARLAPRVGAVLQSVVLPTLLAVADMDAAHASGVLEVADDAMQDPSPLQASAGDAHSLPRGRLLGNLQWLEDVRTWGMYGMLLFPGALPVEQALTLSRLLLAETCLLPVHGDRCEWLAPLMETLVRPALLEGVGNTKGSMDKEQRCVVGVGIYVGRLHGQTEIFLTHITSVCIN